MNRSLLSDLRLKQLLRSQKKSKNISKSLIYNAKRISILSLIFLCILVLLFFRAPEELIHDIGDMNTLLEPLLFIILFIIFLRYFIKRK